MKREGGSQTYTMDQVADLFGIGRNAAYEAAKRGDFPTIRFGKTLRAPKRLIDQMLGLDVESPRAFIAADQVGVARRLTSR